MAQIDRAKIEAAVRMILEGIGDDPDREGVLDTPRRVADMYGEIFEGVGVIPRRSPPWFRAPTSTR